MESTPSQLNLGGRFQRLRDPAWWILTAEKFISFILDPVVVLSLFGPTIVRKALTHVQGDLALKNGDIAISKLLGDPIFPGVVDYTIQFYTALLVFVFWFAKWLNTTLAPWVREPAATTGTKTGLLLRAYFILGLGVIVLSVYVFLLDGAANTKVISIYAKHTVELGVWKWPPLESPITWVRIVVGLVGAAMLLFPALRHKNV